MLNCYFKILCVLYFVSTIVDLVKADEVLKTTEGIKKVINDAEGYTERKDNSDLYSDNIPGKHLDYGKYDIIVVGAGSAGAILAKRLSEYKFRTLVLEAGGEQTNMTDIPGIFKMFQKSDFNWGYKTKPQKHSCQGMVNQQCNCPRGKVMGGSSVLTAMVYARSNQQDHDSWKKEFGISGWSWKDTLPYYKKLENYRKIGGDPKYHGMNGPVHMDIPRPGSYVNYMFLKANREFYKTTDDYNGKQQLGAAISQHHKRKGKRISTNRVYLTKYDKNYLRIESNAFVTKVLIQNKVAIGVEFIKDNKKFRVTATREVVLSAGAINTPQILMLSGIGPKEELDKHKIPVIENLPVGTNLDDHIAFVGLRFISNLTITDKNKPLERYVWEYLSGTGSLSDTGMQSLAFVSTENGTTPDIEIIVAPTGRGLVPSMNDNNYNSDTLKALAIPDDQIDRAFNLLIVLLYSKSRGTVNLQSKNPKDFPIINQNSLSDDEDLERLYKGINYIKKLEETRAFKEIQAKFLKFNLPACKDKEYDSKDYWYCTIRQLSHHVFHPVGTSKMGKKGSSVVDEKLKVHGIERLRIADVSIAPRVDSGHTNTLAMMIGEKAADIIKNDHS